MTCTGPWFCETAAKAKGVPLNELLKKDIVLIEARR